MACPKVALYSNVKPPSLTSQSRVCFHFMSSVVCPLCPSSTNTRFLVPRLETSMVMPSPFLSSGSLSLCMLRTLTVFLSSVVK